MQGTIQERVSSKPGAKQSRPLGARGVRTGAFLLSSIALGLFLVIATTKEVRADEAKAKAYYQKADALSKEGKFKEAIHYLSEAYKEFPHPSTLFNIAQSYRELKDCKHSVFYYKRFLQMQPKSDARDLVEKLIDEENARCKPPSPNDQREKTALVAYRSGKTFFQREQFGSAIHHFQNAYRVLQEPKIVYDIAKSYERLGDCTSVSYYSLFIEKQPQDTDIARAKHRMALERQRCNPQIPESMFTATAELGTSLMFLGGSSLPAQFAFRGKVAYPISFGSWSIEPGLLFSFTSIPYENVSGGQSGRSTLPTLSANGTGYYAWKRFRFRTELALGAAFLSGLGEGNPFTINTSGSLALFHLVLATGADYAVTENFFATLTPLSFSYSPARSPITANVGSLTALSFTAGLVYRL